MNHVCFACMCVLGLGLLPLAGCSSSDEPGEAAGSAGAGGGEAGSGGSEVEAGDEPLVQEAGDEAEAAAPLVYPAPDPGGTDLDEGLRHLNEYRTAAGLQVVEGTADPAAPYGCEGHLDYLIWESENGGGPCYLSHTEGDTANPHNSAENETAGINSVLSCSTGGQSLAQAVDGWIDTLYHRLPLIEPGLQKVGYASKSGYNCINYRPGTKSSVKALHVILWPPDGMTDVPRTFTGFEWPCPTSEDPANTPPEACASSGFIVSGSWFGWANNSGWSPFFASYMPDGGGAPLQIALIDDATNQPVELMWWWADQVPGHDPNEKGYLQETFAIVPKAGLAANHKYRVEFDGTVMEDPVSLRTTFTTGTRL